MPIAKPKSKPKPKQVVDEDDEDEDEEDLVDDEGNPLKYKKSYVLSCTDKDACLHKTKHNGQRVTVNYLRNFGITQCGKKAEDLAHITKREEMCDAIISGSSAPPVAVKEKTPVAKPKQQSRKQKRPSTSTL